MIDYTVSLRARKDEIITEYLSSYYSHIPNINSVFGFSDQCKLYGGRLYKREITDYEINELREHGIYYSIPLTSHYVNLETYNSSKKLLSKNNVKGNSVIVTNDNLAEWIRNDFTNYKIESSVIKNINNIEELEYYSDKYDEIVLHGQWNSNIEKLNTIRCKNKIRLFTSMGCSYNCPSKLCYKNVSQINSGIISTVGIQCTKDFISRKELGAVKFNVNDLILNGFSKFKVLPIDNIAMYI